MENKIFKLIFTVFVLCSTSFMYADTTLEVRAASFIHSSDRFKEIYGRVGPSVQVEAATSLYRCFDGFANVDWSAQNGKSVGLRNRTFVSIVNLSFGLRYPYQICKDFTAYVGIGPSISRIVLTNHYNNGEKRSIYKMGVGGIIKTGVIYNISSDWFLDGFIDYLYQPVDYSTHVDMGGFKIGVGLGYTF